MPNDTYNIEQIASRIAAMWGLPDGADAIGTIAGNLSVRQFAKNETIYREGRTPTRILYVVKGKVKIVKECGTRHQQIVRTINQDSFMGHRAFFAGECYTTSSVAMEPTTVAAITIDVMNGLMDKHRSITQYFVKQLAETLGYTDCRFVSLTQKHVRGRMAETILILKHNYGTESDGATINISMNRNDIASLSNMSTSNAIRTLSAFAGEGIISIEGRKIRIANEPELMRISQLG